MFKFLRKKKKVEAAEIVQSVDRFNQIWEMNIRDIWTIRDPDDFISAMNGWINKKCSYGDDIGALNEVELVFFITQLCEAEVNNGGFAQFFSNSGGAFSNCLENAFAEIGAEKTARICRKAVNVFGKELPEKPEQRRQFIDDCENAEIERVLAACDDAFFDYEENLSYLNYAYVQKNREFFC